ncbi:DUF58 domain-containing protein [Geodermatophilus sabuli]|uniref:Uncharacterized conserved protein, DUF58 family, contains vWF domain n=1 Tax=Geodermatophilus sabuli TaxID=1564158 RepID=A0A285E7D5_9ACTN|nr:DUF58 domain-containing protein [Geodermatophilus sabuli]MBB3082090.1 uncharacterized protein (DUF58 family) [Geodermatophilus sabuli]SNX95038.1 Uncharacterized conserved protein, DUF58 family, contains vWF domain [Geodermatophilus sabuli]
MRGPVATALATLTLRGRCLVAAGLTLLLLGVLLGERPLVQVAVFVLALPLLSTTTVARRRFRVASRRTVTPARVPRGGDAEVCLEVTNAGRGTGGLWLLAETVPPELGTTPEFVVDRLPGGETATLRYRVHGGRRGRYRLGPLRLRLVDPFGLVLRSTAGADSAPLLVVPRVVPLGPDGPAGGHGGGAAGARRSIAVHGEDDVSTRPYRHGDDLRKVHWRATARTGELMVRLEERPWRAQATLLLDTRARAHVLARGHAADLAAGAAGRDTPPPDSLEWLVEAAASIGTELLGRGATLRVVTDAVELAPAEHVHGLGPGELLDRLAAVTPSRLSGLGPGLDLLTRAAGDGPVIALLGAVGPDDAAELVRVRSGPGTDLAVLADIGSWAGTGLTRSRRPATGAARDELVRQREAAARLLRAGGWRVAVASSGDRVPAVWAQLGGPGTPAAGLRGVPA